MTARMRRVRIPRARRILLSAGEYGCTRATPDGPRRKPSRTIPQQRHRPANDPISRNNRRLGGHESLAAQYLGLGLAVVAALVALGGSPG